LTSQAIQGSWRNWTSSTILDRCTVN